MNQTAFEEAVLGPLILGAGRYQGYGLCRPLPEVAEWTGSADSLALDDAAPGAAASASGGESAAHQRAGMS